MTTQDRIERARNFLAEIDERDEWTTRPAYHLGRAQAIIMDLIRELERLTEGKQ